METNSEKIFHNQSSLMDDDNFPITEGEDYFSGFGREDLVIADNLWSGEYVDPWLLPQQYHLPSPLDELCNQALEFPQISSSSLQSADPVHEGKRTFRKYDENSSMGTHLFSPSKINQEIRSCWEVDEGVVEDADAFTHMISERKRRSKLGKLFLDLRSVLPHNSNSKKVDKISTLSNAMRELNQNRLLIGQLEQQNHKLSNAISHSVREIYSSLSNGCTAHLGRNPLMAYDCEEVVVVIEESIIPEEAIIQVSMKKTSSCTHMDAVVTLVKCLREIKLEIEVVRIESREIDATKLEFEVKIRSKTEGERLEINKRKELQEMVKNALSLT